MELKQNQKQIQLAYELMQNMQSSHFDYFYKGEFTSDIISNILNLVEKNLSRMKDSAKNRKKIFFVIVEILQNMTRHQLKKEILPNCSGIFTIQRKDNSYFITAGNTIEEKEIKGLTAQFDKINSMKFEELKKLYYRILEEGSISTKGGAGLGLIAIARKTGKEFCFKFEPIKNSFHYFYLSIEISLSRKLPPINPIINDYFKQSVAGITKTHKYLDKHKILVNFNGDFNQNNFINLFNIISEQLEGKIELKRKVFQILIEMLQNIVFYAKNIESLIAKQEKQNPGIFLLHKQDNNIYLIAGNFIETNKVEILEDKIKFVNNLTQEKLISFYKENLLKFNKDGIRKPDLSIIDMKLKSEYDLDYDFVKIDNSYSFFSLQIKISRK